MGQSDDKRIILEAINEGIQYYEAGANEDCSQYFNEEPTGVETEQHEDEQQDQDRQSNVSSKKARGQRGQARKVEERHIIIAVKEDGEPFAPEAAATKFVSQCGWVVRDNVPISVQNWRKGKSDSKGTYVEESEKEMLWTTLLETFTLQITEAEQSKLKDWALKKMATQFQAFKNILYKKYVVKGLTPDFNKYTKLKDHCTAFMEYKT